MTSWRDLIEPGKVPRLGLSSCLLGERVRYDGGHKRCSFLVDELAPHVELVAVCPEFELGMGVPRPALRLELDAHNDLRLVDRANALDWTERMRAFALAKCDQLASLALDGYLLKSRSPSCALGDLPVHAEHGALLPQVAAGFFASALRRRLPELPVLDETALADARQRRAFLARLFGRRAT